MLQHLPSLPVVVGFLVAFVASFSRIFTATRAFWGRFPAWLQMLAPQIALALGAIGTGLAGGIRSWTDLTVVFIGASALLLPGLPSNRSSAPLQAGKAPTLSPSPQDVAVSANVVKIASIAPPERMFPSLVPSAIEQDAIKTPKDWSGPSGGLVLLLAVAFAWHSTGCSIFGSGGSFWPKVENCAPSPASLVSQVADILLAGGDYEEALKQLALRDTAAAVLCAVRAATDSFLAKAGKVGASPEDAPAAARGKAFLAKHPVGQ